MTNRTAKTTIAIKTPPFDLGNLKKILLTDFDHLCKKASTTPAGPIDVIDMFSGCGGMSAGFRALNGIVPAYRLALAVDIDKDSNRSYEANLGLTPENLDIAALARSRTKLLGLVADARPRPDRPLIMIGCAPCQGFSSHRNATGELDERNSLFVSFAHIATCIKPDTIVVENVPEILTDRYWPVVVEARRILSRAGYLTLLGVYDMAEFSVPQNRYRAIMIGIAQAVQYASRLRQALSLSDCSPSHWTSATHLCWRSVSWRPHAFHG